jgi:hypothetical protein
MPAAHKETHPDTPADAGIVRSRPWVAEKKISRNYPVCPHCADGRLTFHCKTLQACTWLLCDDCGALIDPSDWSHAFNRGGLAHGRTLFKHCSGK